MGNNRHGRTLCDGLFGKTRQAVLALLYETADVALYTRQILDAVKAGRGTVQRELKNLTDTGIITREVRGRQVYYRANEKCPIFDELRGIIRKTFGLVDVIRQALGPAVDRIAVSFVFGSLASRTESRSSDVDLMVIGEITFAEIASLVSQAQTTLGREINPVVYPTSEFKQKVQDDHNFLKTVLSGDKVFVVGDESDVRRLVEERAAEKTQSRP